MNAAIVDTVELLLPHQIDRAAHFLEKQQQQHHAAAACNDGSSLSFTVNVNDTTVYYLTLHVRPAGALWKALQPLLFYHEDDAPHDRMARHALACLLAHRHCYDWEKIQQRGRMLDLSGRSTSQAVDDDNVTVAEDFGIQRRSLKRVPIPSYPATATNINNNNNNNNSSQTAVPRIVLWIQPPTVARVDYLLAGLLIRWEHRFIQAQSLAGYIATLGGGFFLCHHFSTAMFLAQQQQRLAVLLNDERMYYACSVNQAYSCIYNGKFRTAQSILRQVLAHNAVAADPVLVKMCRSAQLFGRRMRRASRSKQLVGGSRNSSSAASAAATGDGGGGSDASNKNVDDFQRIRVVRDKSRKDDLVIPFSRASTGAS